jgi:hypothetical protein
MKSLIICVMMLATVAMADRYFLEYATEDDTRWLSTFSQSDSATVPSAGGWSQYPSDTEPSEVVDIFRVTIEAADAAEYNSWMTQTPADVPQAVRDAAILAAQSISANHDVRDTAASNIVVLASSYGVTDQPVSWAAVATAMQVERIDATASNDIMRLLTVIGDGTTLLSFKEFYSENGGDVFNVRWP